MKKKIRKFEIYGQNRIVRDVRTDTETDFDAYYRNYSITIQLDPESGWIYAWCSHPDGGLIVDGYIEPKSPKRVAATIDDGIKECLENILYKERPTA